MTSVWAVLGSTGFVGKNMLGVLRRDQERCSGYSRSEPADSAFHLDLSDERTWSNVTAAGPTHIVDAIGYGVVKHESQVELVYDINYRYKIELYRYITARLPEVVWYHIGSAFEYELQAESITEGSPRSPLTHYGISKLMFSRYLEEHPRGKLTKSLMPFGMFGAHEDESKIVPTLILAQKRAEAIALSDGTQERDYIYVEDLCRFILDDAKIGREWSTPWIVLIGSGKSQSLRDLAERLIPHLPRYSAELWNWGALPTRPHEAPRFYNGSSLGRQLGLTITPQDESLPTVIRHYWDSAN